MKWYVVVSVVTIMFCVRESDSFKILKKLKDLIHPTESTVSTTTGVPYIPAYEKQHGQREDDSSSSERESSTSNIKSKHSDEDLSTSQSSENQGGSFSNSKNKYNPVKPDKTKSHPGYSFQPNPQTTETSNYDSGYGGNKEKNQFSSYDSSSNIGPTRTTTDNYDQIYKEIYPGQTSPDSFVNQEVKSTTSSNYDSGSQNQPDQIAEGVNNQRNKTYTENNYDGPYGSNTPGQASSFGGALDGIMSSTPNSYEVSSGSSDIVGHSTSTGNSDSSQNQANDDQSSGSSVSNYEKSQSTTPRADYSFSDINNIPDQSSSLGSAFDNVGPSTSTARYSGSQNQNYDDQTSMLGNVNSEKTQSSTPRSYGSSYGFDKPDQSSSFDGQYFQTTTNLNEVDSELSLGNNYNAGPFVSTSTTLMTPVDPPESSFQGVNQHKKPSGLQPSYSSPKGSNQKEKQHIDGGIIIYPDHPSLNPTPETERMFGENDPNFKRNKGLHNSTPAPVNDEEGRHIVDAPSRNCGPGQTLDRQRNACRKLERSVARTTFGISLRRIINSPSKTCGPGLTFVKKENVCKDLARSVAGITYFPFIML